MSSLDDILAGGAATAKFENPGDTHTGRITAINVRQARDFDTGKPATWDDGSPQEQIVVTIATDERDPANPDDDGERTVYIKGWGQPLQAFRAAVKQGGKPAVGDTFTASFTQYGPKPDRGFPPKHYVYQVVKASPLDAVLGGQPAQDAHPQLAQQFPPTGYASGGVVGGQPAPAAPPVSAPAAQPVSAPAPVAPVAAPAEDPNAKVRQLISLGLDDATIAGAVGLDASVVAIFRAQAA